MKPVLGFGPRALLLSSSAIAASVPRSDQPDQFQIYAYGTGLGGLTLFSSGEDALLGDYAAVDSNQAAPVIFTVDNNVWLGSPNKTVFDDSSKSPSWSNQTFAIPTAATSGVGFVNSTTDSTGMITEGFTFYGSYILFSSDGKLEGLWYAVSSDVDGVYSLKWDLSGDSKEGGIPVTLKSNPPSN